MRAGTIARRKYWNTLMHYTIGTGVVAGVIQREGEFIGGTSHPEMGHVYVNGIQ